MRTQHTKPRWHHNHFEDADTDPLTGFANIMDVMLVFALGLLIVLLSQSQELRGYFQLQENLIVQPGQELLEVPESLKKALNSGPEGMESLGTVYRDPDTGKLILINR